MPLDYSNPDRESISLFFATLNVPLSSQTHKPSAFTFIPGGPGSATTRFIPLIPALPPAFKQQRIALLDLRGTGFSQALVCPTVSRFDIKPTYAANCARLLGPRRIHFNSANNARDLERLRQALKIGKWDLAGQSYGTQTAALYIKFFPHALRTVTLDSAFTLDTLGDRLSFYRAYRQAFAKVCQRQGFCNAEKSIEELGIVLEKLRINPVQGSLTTKGVYSMATDLSIAKNFTMALTKAAREDDFDNLNKLQQERIAADVAQFQNPMVSSFGLSLATSCLEIDFPYSPTDCECDQQAKYDADLLNSVSSKPFAPFFALEIAGGDRCIGWPRLPVDVRYESLVPPKSDFIGAKNVPVLVLAGELDLTTPVENGRRAARRFANVRFGVVGNTGHAVGLLSECARQLVNEFIASASFPDTTKCSDPASQPFAVFGLPPP